MFFKPEVGKERTSDLFEVFNCHQPFTHHALHERDFPECNADRIAMTPQAVGQRSWTKKPNPSSEDIEVSQALASASKSKISPKTKRSIPFVLPGKQKRKNKLEYLLGIVVWFSGLFFQRNYHFRLIFTRSFLFARLFSFFLFFYWQVLLRLPAILEKTWGSFAANETWPANKHHKDRLFSLF